MNKDSVKRIYITIVKFIILFILTIIGAFSVQAQIEESFLSDWPGIEQLFKQDSVGSYYHIGKDRILFSDKDHRIYRILDHDLKVIEEGETGSSCVDCPARAGKCTAFYPGKKVKASGHYNYRGAPIGTWLHYFRNGELEKIVNYDVTYPGFKAGSYELYYKNGRIKESGFYCIVLGDTTITDSLMVTDVQTGETKPVISRRTGTGPSSVRCGQWNYFDSAGALTKRDEME